MKNIFFYKIIFLFLGACNENYFLKKPKINLEVKSKTDNYFIETQGRVDFHKNVYFIKYPIVNPIKTDLGIIFYPLQPIKVYFDNFSKKNFNCGQKVKIKYLKKNPYFFIFI
jgi:hypothetical protein